MKISRILILLSLLLAGLQSCYYDVEERLYPNSGACDTSNVTLLTKVKPVLLVNCYSCHSVSTCVASGASINLETYATLKSQVDNGKLLKSIKHEAGASAMPKNSSTSMDVCSINIITIWITKGALNN